MGKGIVKLGEGQWAVKDGNLLAAKETNGRFKNTEFTVSRGTRASYVGRDGLIKESNLQDVNLVNNGDFSELGSELVVNGTFDTDSDWTKSTGWSIEDGSASYDGSGTGYQYVSQAITTTSGNVYKINFDVLSSTGSNLNIVDFGSVRVNQTHLSAGNYTYYAEADAASENLTIYANGTDTFSIDNISVKEVDPNDYWSTTSTVTVKDGFANITSDSSYQYLRQLNIVEVGKSYKLTYEITRQGSGILKSSSLGLNSIPSIVGTHTVYGVSLQTYIVIDRAGACDIDITNISVQEVKTDTPRIDFTDNTDGHLLLEPQSTNLVTYSEDFTDSSWIKLGAGTGSTAIVTPNYAISPDGTQNASRLQCDLNGGGSSSSNQSLIYDLYSSSGNQTLSIYVKSNTGSNQTIYLANTQTSGDTITVTNEWQRFEFNYSSSLYVFAVGLRGRSGGAIDDTADVLIWAAQAEALSYPTSYIPTNGSTVTRDADTCTGAGSSADFNSEEGVLYVEISALANDGTFRMIGVSDSTENNKIDLYYRSNFDQITLRLISNGVQQIFEKFDITATNFSKMAFRYKSGESNLFIDGVKQKESNYPTVSMPIGLSELAFDNGAGTDNFYGKCKAIRVYKEALSDTDLQNLTS